MRVPHGSTILVADGRKRLIVRNAGDADTLDLEVVGAAEEASRATHEIVSDAAGRVGGSSLGGSDPHEHEEERFAIETAALLRRRVEDDATEQLIVVAAPRTLGVLRKHYHKMVTDRILAEIDKDVTGQPLDAIAKLLSAR